MTLFTLLEDFLLVCVKIVQWFLNKPAQNLITSLPHDVCVLADKLSKLFSAPAFRKGPFTL